MTDRLPSLASHALAVGISLGVLALLYATTAAPLISRYGDQRDSIAQMETRLAHYQRAAANLGARQARLEALKQRQSGQSGFLGGANDALAAVGIQNKIKELTGVSRATLKSIQVMPAVDEGKFRRITVRGQISTTIGGAQRLFYGLEAGQPLLFVDNVDIRARSENNRFRQRDEPDDQLEIDFDVYGYTNRAR